ncbi:MAG TPA: GntR family transcriptional regulator [Draconibacterium sp.]|nr:GntR family transcriptional regulator [Draconibacterium sp.]
MEIQHQDLSYEVYKKLKTMILAKEFEAGEKLKQEQIALMLGVSRMPLHKAFQMLENEMLVENLPRRGFYVTKIDDRQLIDAFECREALEGVAARRAAATIKKSDVAYLKSLFKPFIGKKDIDVKKYVIADQEFHNVILKLSGNAVLRRFEILSNITLHTYRGGLIRQPEDTLPEHLGIIDALEKGDSELAENLIREHSKKSCKVLRQRLDEEF